jgi:hypothetical protein
MRYQYFIVFDSKIYLLGYFTLFLVDTYSLPTTSSC